LAVLPPTDLTNDPEQEYFVQGMHNALISELQRVGIAVIARTSVLQYQNTQKSIREIAAELGVDALIEPSVFRSGDSVELEVRVVDGTTEEYLADPMSRSGTLENVVTLYRELTGAIAAEIQVTLTPQAEARLATARTVNPDAYEAYLKGQFHWYKLTPTDLKTALQYYDVALQHDPDYALAYAGISLAWAGLQQMALVPASEAGPQVRAAALRAAEMDGTLVEVQYALAIAKGWTDWDWPGAEAAFRKAIEINPNYPDVRAYYAHFLCSMKRPDEAIEQMERAAELDPFHPLIMGLHGAALTMVGRHDDAIEQFQLLLQTVPNHPVALNGLLSTYYVKGMYDEAVQAATAYYNVIEFSEGEAALTAGYAEGGFEEAMKRTAETYVALSEAAWVPAIEVASLYMLAGMDDQACEWLERAYEERDPNLPYWNAWPVSASLGADPRFHDLLRRVGLP
jgi:TolB-like protein/Tfp pilus assembly protein PilF